MGNALSHRRWRTGGSELAPPTVPEHISLLNLLWALGYNAVALGFAAAGYLHPLLAALAMAASSLTILANSSRVRNGKTTTFTTEVTENTEQEKEFKRRRNYKEE